MIKAARAAIRAASNVTMRATHLSIESHHISHLVHCRKDKSARPVVRYRILFEIGQARFTLHSTDARTLARMEHQRHSWQRQRSFRRSEPSGFVPLLVTASVATFLAVSGLAGPSVQADPEARRRTEASAYYPNCAAARAAGAAPIYSGEPGYRPNLDGDSDGIACEPYRGR